MLVNFQKPRHILGCALNTEKSFRIFFDHAASNKEMYNISAYVL
jgi:hypothetical protein